MVSSRPHQKIWSTTESATYIVLYGLLRNTLDTKQDQIRSNEEFDKILQALKNRTNPGIHVPEPSLDNMPIITKTKNGITYTIRVKTPKTESVEPK